MIVFTSDNGAPTVGLMNNLGVNLPLRGIKYTPWEGGVRVPAFIWHSSLMPRVWDGLMHITDWLPTLIAAAGGRVGTEIDGVNQWDPISKERPSNRKEVLITIEDGDTNSYAAYRSGDYKIIVGNVTGLQSGYYGAQYLINKRNPPKYFQAFESCDVTNVLGTMGYYFDSDKVQEIRNSTIVRQNDPVVDLNPCLPSPGKYIYYKIYLWI